MLYSYTVGEDWSIGVLIRSVGQNSALPEYTSNPAWTSAKYWLQVILRGMGRGLEYERFSIVLTPSDDPKLEETDKSERVINWQEP